MGPFEKALAEGASVDEAFELGPKIMKAAKAAIKAARERSGLSLPDAIRHAARKFKVSESGINQAVAELRGRRESVDESWGAKITVYVDFVGGSWESHYRHTDEQRDYSFTSHDRKDAIRKAIRHTGYSPKEVKVVNISNRSESVDEAFADFQIKLFNPEPEFGTWEFEVLIKNEAALNQIENLKEPAGIILNDVDGHGGKINVYFVVEGRSESDAKRKLESHLKKALGTQLSMF